MADNTSITLPTDPAEAKRFAKALEIMQLTVQDGMSVEAACEQVGISRPTYYEWVKKGVFAPLIQAWMLPIVQDLQTGAIKDLPAIIHKRAEVAKGNVQGATQIDQHMAATFVFNVAKTLGLLQLSLLPSFVPATEEADEAAKFLEEQHDWELPDLKPGEKLTVTVEKTATETINVTPSEVPDGEFRLETDPPA